MAEAISNDISSYSSSLDNVAVDQSILGKDDFMKLLLVELQHQDPTSPMDSDKILSQTSQLAALETQEKTNTALKELSASFGGNKNFEAVSSIGKMARLETDFTLKANEDGSANPTNFDLNFNEAIKSGKIQILDENKNLVKTIQLDEKDKGAHNFKWDGLTDAGNVAKAGDYTISTVYEAYQSLQTQGTLTANADGTLRPINFEFNFSEDAPVGKIKIFNKAKELVDTINFKDKPQGVNLFSWNGKSNYGTDLPEGDYTIKAYYEGEKPLVLNADGGNYKIESVKFDEGKTYVKLNGDYILFNKVNEIYEA